MRKVDDVLPGTTRWVWLTFHRLLLFRFSAFLFTFQVLFFQHFFRFYYSICMRFREDVTHASFAEAGNWKDFQAVYVSTDILLWAIFWSLFDHYSYQNILKVTENAIAVSCYKWLYHAKFHNLQKDTKSAKRLSIPVRVTRLNQRRTLILVGVRLFIVGAYGALRIFWITKHRKIHAPFAVLVVKE